MAVYFDQDRWDLALEHEDWYLRIWNELKALHKRARDGEPEAEEIKNELRGYFIKRMQEGRIPLATSGPNLDEERQPIDTVVIHHTSNSEPYSLEKLNVVQMLNLYVSYLVEPGNDAEKSLKGQALWSNHLRQGRPVFWAYHWLVRRDGRVEHLLEDQEIGWQAGNWDINTRSVAICLDNDYEHGQPSEAELAAVAGIIKEHYSQVRLERVVGHCEVNSKTSCPGEYFLTGWKPKLLEKLT
jgi:hypothetical protein